MSDQESVQAQLAAWRQCGADGMDPLRFECIDALACRAAGQTGAVRSLLDARLRERIDAYAADLARRSTSDTRDAGPGPGAAAARGALSALLDHFEQHAVENKPTQRDETKQSARAVSVALDDVRRICASARTESQVRQALEAEPGDAGPLNSSRLVHRALNLMRDVSPEYLQPFMAYIDTLARLEDMGLHGGLALKGAAAAKTGKRPRPSARSHRA